MNFVNKMVDQQVFNTFPMISFVTFYSCEEGPIFNIFLEKCIVQNVTAISKIT